MDIIGYIWELIRRYDNMPNRDFLDGDIPIKEVLGNKSDLDKIVKEINKRLKKLNYEGRLQYQEDLTLNQLITQTNNIVNNYDNTKN